MRIKTVTISLYNFEQESKRKSNVHFLWCWIYHGYVICLCFHFDQQFGDMLMGGVDGIVYVHILFS